jgi:hypothetical protein
MLSSVKTTVRALGGQMQNSTFAKTCFIGRMDFVPFSAFSNQTSSTEQQYILFPTDPTRDQIVCQEYMCNGLTLNFQN